MQDLQNEGLLLLVVQKATRARISEAGTVMDAREWHV
jgi:hypothetical protein